MVTAVSTFRGITHDQRSNRFGARIRIDGVRRWLGTFDTAEAAARAYERAMRDAGLVRSRYRGVGWRAKQQRYVVRIMAEGVNHFVGYFDDELKAARAYDRAAVDLFGARAKLNFPEEWKQLDLLRAFPDFDQPDELTDYRHAALLRVAREANLNAVIDYIHDDQMIVWEPGAHVVQLTSAAHCTCNRFGVHGNCEHRAFVHELARRGLASSDPVTVMSLEEEPQS